MVPDSIREESEGEMTDLTNGGERLAAHERLST